MQERSDFETLNVVYHRAWHRFVVEVDHWQSLKVQSLTAQESAVAVEQAEILYRKSPIALADYLISNKRKALPNVARFHPRSEAFRAVAGSAGSLGGSSLPTA
jgi:hypothetical protein